MLEHDDTSVKLVVIVLTVFTAVAAWPKTGDAHLVKAAALTEAGAKAAKIAERKDTERAMPAPKVSLEAWNAAPVWNKVAAENAMTATEVAISTARRQLGKPYRWASTGPNSFDCSGLMLYSYRKAGVELPRTSSAQRAGTKPIPLSEMKPGDLVFAPGHVGMYIGKGQMIHSPHSGEHVEVAPLHDNVYGAGRPA